MSSVTITPLSVFWTLLSLALASALCASFVAPTWFIKSGNLDLSSFGLYSYCVHSPGPGSIEVCQIFGGGRFDLMTLPVGVWQAAVVLFGGGCIMCSLGALLSLSSLFFALNTHKKLALFAGYVQTVSVLILMAGLVLFPLGLDNAFVRQYCGQSAIFNAGDCEIGWGYMLAIMSTAIAMFCPVFAKYLSSVRKEYVSLPSNNLNAPPLLSHV
ncbi:LHFPL tetraspan subfamily member 7 protein-like [Ptychodera flava]|uniref:LHFPL tetraspan subfamily member 7 protein-like n=1 Tax=Ptychodera flava TaxID=63121 RepID=UPI00396A718F